MIIFIYKSIYKYIAIIILIYVHINFFMRNYVYYITTNYFYFIYNLFLPFAMAATSSASNVSYCNKASASCLCSFECVFKIAFARSYDSYKTSKKDIQ